MILYSVCTTYHLIEALIHKCGYKQDSQANLMISNWLSQKYPWYKRLSVFFENIIVFDGHYPISEETKQYLDHYYEGILEQGDITLENMEEIHVFGAEHSFGAFITMNEIPYYFWEEGAGALGKSDSMRSLFNVLHGEQKSDFQIRYHLDDGNSPFVIKRYYDKYFQDEDVLGDDLIHFDVAEELRKISLKDRETIIELFYPEAKISPYPGTCLVLSENFANINVMDWDEQELLYRLIIDYFLSDYHLLFKPHPDDLMYYENIFEESNIIRKKFPAELLPFIFTELPECVATVSSTSIYGFRNIFKKVLEFNFTFSHKKQFYNLNRYYVALSIAEKYIKKNYLFNILGVNHTIIDNFAGFTELHTGDYTEYESLEEFDEKSTYPKNVWIIDEVVDSHENAIKLCNSLDKIPTDSIIIFINSDEQYCFYDLERKYIWDKITPIEIEMIINKKDNTDIFNVLSSNKCKTETIYIYSKEDVRMNKLKKELPNTGAIVCAKEFEGDKKQIKVLEGILEATEKRLLYYINKEKEDSRRSKQ